MEKKALSFTQINTYLRCPRQYHYRYVLGIRTLPSGSMVQSRVWHETVERNYRQKITNHEDLPLELQAFYAERFDEALKLEDVAFDAAESAGALKDEGLAIVAAHHREIAPAVQPLFVEKPFRVSLGTDFPYELARAIDQNVFFPNPNGWHCSPKWCGYWERCMGLKNHQEVKP